MQWWPWRGLWDVETDRSLTSSGLASTLPLSVKDHSWKYPLHPSFEVFPRAWIHNGLLWVSLLWLIICTKSILGCGFSSPTYITGYFYSLMNLTHLCNHTVSRNPDVPQSTSGFHALANICCKHQRLFVGFNVLAHLLPSEGERLKPDSVASKCFRP